ncbi:MAG: DUF2937 family protein [Nevskia sp.]|nr:DUF2937 family protein [Nevskia sp.]
MLFRFLTILGACAALLLGIQVPAFADQYLKRLDAHLAEVTANLRGYQEIADRYFDGSMDRLILKHTLSEDPVFHAEGLTIRRMYWRYQHFKEERAALDTSWLRQLWVILEQDDKALIRETWAGYTPVAMLNAPAMYCGLFLVVVVLVLSEIAAALIRLFRPDHTRHVPGH